MLAIYTGKGVTLEMNLREHIDQTSGGSRIFPSGVRGGISIAENCMNMIASIVPQPPPPPAGFIYIVCMRVGSADLCEGLMSISQQLVWIHLNYLLLGLCTTESTC